MLKKIKLLKKPLFQKRRWSCDFRPRKTPVALKYRAISRQEKMAFSTPVGLSWESPPPSKESVRTDGRTDVRTYGRTDGRSRDYYVILRLIGYHISLAMELRWRALPSGSAIISIFKNKNVLSVSPKSGVMLHPNFPITACSPQRPLTSVSKVAVVGRFDCILLI